MPTVLTVASALEPDVGGVRFSSCERGGPLPRRSIGVVVVNHSSPRRDVDFTGSPSGVLEPSMIHVIDGPIAVGAPDDLRHCLRDLTVALTRPRTLGSGEPRALIE